MPLTELTPVPGNPTDVSASARQLDSLAAEVAATSAKLRALATSGTAWTGGAAVRARARSATLPPKLDKVQASYATAGAALQRYALALDDAQRQSTSAIRTAVSAADELAAARSAQQQAAERDAAAAQSAAASGIPAPVPTAPRYDSAIAEATARLARAREANAAAHDVQRRAAQVAARSLQQAAHEGMRNKPWWRHVLSSAAHWASTNWSRSLRVLSRVASTISALAGLAALVVSIAGIVFPPLEAAAAVLETISLVSGVMAAVADTALAAAGQGSWTTVASDALAFAPMAGSALIRKAAPVLRRMRFLKPTTVVHAGSSASAIEAGTQASRAAERHDLVTALADSYRPPMHHGNPLTVAVLETNSGTLYSGRSGFRDKLADRLRNVLADIPEDARSDFHGHCAEIHCINQALAQGDDVAGSVVITARVRGLNSPNHGTAIEPCKTCARVLEIFGGTYQP